MTHDLRSQEKRVKIKAEVLAMKRNLLISEIIRNERRIKIKMFSGAGRLIFS